MRMRSGLIAAVLAVCGAAAVASADGVQSFGGKSRASATASGGSAQGEMKSVRRVSAVNDAPANTPAPAGDAAAAPSGGAPPSSDAPSPKPRPAGDRSADAPVPEAYDLSDPPPPPPAAGKGAKSSAAPPLAKDLDDAKGSQAGAPAGRIVHRTDRVKRASALAADKSAKSAGAPSAAAVALPKLSLSNVSKAAAAPKASVVAPSARARVEAPKPTTPAAPVKKPVTRF